MHAVKVFGRYALLVDGTRYLRETLHTSLLRLVLTELGLPARANGS